MIWFLQKINATGYEVLISLVVANQLAQLAKTIVNAIVNRSLNPKMFFSTGGMPSSHSATVCAMAASIGLISGFHSVIFALAVCVASIVMYDAAGVRRAASRQAWVVNLIVRELFSENHLLKKERLKELLGHTPLEVVAGGFFGVAISFLIRYGISESLGVPF